MTIDGFPLSPASQANLARLVQMAGLAQAPAIPSARAQLDDVAASVIAAFKLGNHLVDGTWQVRALLRLSGGAIVARTL